MDILLCKNLTCKLYCSPQGHVQVWQPVLNYTKDSDPFIEPRTKSRQFITPEEQFDLPPIPKQLNPIKLTLAGLTTLPRCRRCGAYYKAGLTKKGVPTKAESLCWICSNWAAEYRGVREVYDDDGKVLI